MYVAGKIIKKIGPILAIKNKEFYNNYVAKNLINNSPNNLKNLKITGLSLNSRDIKKGFIFFAIRGHKLNGENYINEAIEKGAVLIICSNKCRFNRKN